MARRTPLYEAHRALGARMIDFGGWEMPLLYRGPAEEHQAVRRHCGLFDVSHMGEIEVSGPNAAAACQELTVNDVARLKIGDAQYTLLCNEAGGVLDDLVVYRLGAERYLLIVNAANTEQDLGWIASHCWSGRGGGPQRGSCAPGAAGSRGGSGAEAAHGARPDGASRLHGMHDARRGRSRGAVADGLHRRGRVRDPRGGGSGAHALGRSAGERRAAGRAPRRARR